MGDELNILHAVSKAAGRSLDVDDFNDRLIIQKGCYILNSHGYGPRFRFSLYIRGPYSSDLADAYYKHRHELDGPTDIPGSEIEELKCILDKGIRFAEAYSTVLLVKNSSMNPSPEGITKRSLAIKPHLRREIEEACE